MKHSQIIYVRGCKIRVHKNDAVKWIEKEKELVRKELAHNRLP